MSSCKAGTSAFTKMTQLLLKLKEAQTPRSSRFDTSTPEPFPTTKVPFILLGRTAERTLWTRDRSPFRFLDLPQEIQDTILRLHLQEPKLVLVGQCRRCRQKSSSEHDCRQNFEARIESKLPSLALERTCSKIRLDSRIMREKLWPKTLIVVEKVSIADCVKQLCGSKFQWLRKHITKIVFEEVHRYALHTKPPFRRLAAGAPKLRTFHIHQRNRAGYVDWRNNFDGHATADDPDDTNLKCLHPATLTALAKALHEMSDEDYVVKVDSTMWWSLVHHKPQECFEKVIEYNFRHDKHEVVSRRFELKELENARSGESKLPEDDSP